MLKDFINLFNSKPSNQMNVLSNPDETQTLTESFTIRTIQNGQYIGLSSECYPVGYEKERPESFGTYDEAKAHIETELQPGLYQIEKSFVKA